MSCFNRLTRIYSVTGVFEFWVFCSFLLFISVLSDLIQKEFSTNHKNLKNTMERYKNSTSNSNENSSSNRNHTQIEDIRLQHRFLNQIVTCIDNILAGHLIVMFALTIPYIFSLIFLLLSSKAWTRVDTGTNVYGTVWCASMALNVVILTLSGSSVSTAVSIQLRVSGGSRISRRGGRGPYRGGRAWTPKEVMF